MEIEKRSYTQMTLAVREKISRGLATRDSVMEPLLCNLDLRAARLDVKFGATA